MALTCRVTLPVGGITKLVGAKLAVDPAKVVVPPTTGLPLFRRLRLLIPVEGLPVPVDERVTLVKVTGTVPLLVATIWATGRLVTPCNWVELGGIEGPEEIVTVAGVGVEVAVFTGLFVAVLVAVKVGERVAVEVGV